jgi:hypothetical protein
MSFFTYFYTPLKQPLVANAPLKVGVVSSAKQPGLDTPYPAILSNTSFELGQ